MKVVALISGGKDSCFNMMQCIASGHEIVALANITPTLKTEIDSFMYQSVGHEAISLIAEAMRLPLFRHETDGLSHHKELNYSPTEHDEVEDLFMLLKKVQTTLSFDAVSVGAVLSDYQRIRVENVCTRLGLVCLAYLWQRNQHELLKEMIDCGIDAITIKVAALGLVPSKHLGCKLRQLEPHLHLMHEKYGLHVCGEGGEYETLVLDCPLYSSKLVIEEAEVVLHSDDAIAPVAFLKLNRIKLEAKSNVYDFKTCLADVLLKDSDGYVTDYGEEAEESFCEEECEDGDMFNNVSNESECVDVVHFDQTIVYQQNNGWLWIGGITGSGDDCGQALFDALEKLKSILEQHNHTFKNIRSLCLYISDMSKFSQLNAMYITFLNHINPPTRACVEVPLPKDQPVLLEVVSWTPMSLTPGDIEINWRTLHVQSISHWAPASIGPYSQAVRIGDIIYLAGIIGLVPGSLELVKGGFNHQCQLALKHINRIVVAIEASANLRDIVQAVCYLTDRKYVQSARKIWESKTKNAIVNYVVVTGLPKNALVEWHVWAHKYNSTFEYEETGKCVDDWSISIYRRRSFENDIASIVGIVSNLGSDKQAIPVDAYTVILQYLIEKLQQGQDPPKSVCSLKIFYVVSKIVSLNAIVEVLKELNQTSQIVYTLVPVFSLQNHHSYLSISGMRM